MARHSAIDDQSGQARGVQPGDPRAGASAPRDTPDLLRVLMRGHLLRGDLPTAMTVAATLSADAPGHPDPVELLVDAALEHRRVDLARAVLGQVEQTIAAPQSAHFKARIAMTEGDFPAAKAILVTAIEDAPDQPMLRALLAEVMVAAGTAAEARAVLAHLGQPPANPPPPPDNDRDDDRGPDMTGPGDGPIPGTRTG